MTSRTHQLEDEAKVSRQIRIVTTLPSATEIVALLGLEQNLVGVTHECDYPPSITKKPVVMRSVFDTTKMNNREIDESVLSTLTKGNSLYEIDEQLLKSLKPDLIITQELCEVCATPLSDVSRAIGCLEPKPSVLSLTPHTIADVLEDIIRVGRATGEVEKAERAVSELQKRIGEVRKRCEGFDKLRVVCLEWMDPIYCSGHWMPELVDYAGGKEVLGKHGEPSTIVLWEDVVRADPDAIFFTVCGYNVERTLQEIEALTKCQGWGNLKAVREGRVYVLDGGSYYSRSGPRLVDGLEIMAYLLHPETFSDYRMPRGAAYSLSIGIYC